MRDGAARHGQGQSSSWRSVPTQGAPDDAPRHSQLPALALGGAAGAASAATGASDATATLPSTGTAPAPPDTSGAASGSDIFSIFKLKRAQLGPPKWAPTGRRHRQTGLRLTAWRSTRQTPPGILVWLRPLVVLSTGLSSSRDGQLTLNFLKRASKYAPLFLALQQAEDGPQKRWQSSAQQADPSASSWQPSQQADPTPHPPWLGSQQARLLNQQDGLHLNRWRHIGHRCPPRARHCVELRFHFWRRCVCQWRRRVRRRCPTLPSPRRRRVPLYAGDEGIKGWALPEAHLRPS